MAGGSRQGRKVGMPAHKTQSEPVSSSRVGGMNVESGIHQQALRSDSRSRVELILFKSPWAPCVGRLA